MLTAFNANCPAASPHMLQMPAQRASVRSFYRSQLKGRSWHAIVSFFWASLLLGIASTGTAAPLTFHFQAQVASVLPDGGGVDLPVQISVGDTIKGRFTFDPSIEGPSSLQNGQLVFEIHGTEFEMHGYRIRVANDDFPNAIPLEYSIANPAHILGDVAPGSSDSIVLSSAATGGYSGVIEGHPELTLDPRLVFANDDSLLSSTELITDTAIWNAFSFREMSLSFIDDTAGSSIYIGAQIGPVAAIPEPSSLLHAIAGGALIMYSIRGHRRA